MLQITCPDASIHSLRRLRCLAPYCSTLRRFQTPLMADLKPFLTTTQCNGTIVELDVSALPTPSAAAVINSDRNGVVVAGPSPPPPTANAITAVPKDVPMQRLRYFKANGAVTLKNIEGLNNTNTPMLSKLLISGTSVGTLPSNLPKELQYVDLSRCERLSSLASLAHAASLTKLDISFTTNITHVPSLPMLDTLNAQQSALKHLETLPQLLRLNITKCTHLKALPKIPKVELIHAAFATNLSDIKTLRDSPSLSDLNISNNDEITIVPKMTGLRRFIANRAIGLIEWPSMGECLSLMVELQLGDADGLQLSALPKGLTSIRHLNLSGMRTLRDITSLQDSYTLETLDLTRCESLQPKLPSLPKLTRLIAPSSSLRDITSLTDSPLLTELNISSTIRIASLPKMPKIMVLCAAGSQLVDVGALQGTAIEEVVLPRKAAAFLSKLPKSKFKRLKHAVDDEGRPITWS